VDWGLYLHLGGEGEGGSDGDAQRKDGAGGGIIS